MGPEQAKQLKYILGAMAVGVAILDAETLCVCYANPYLCSLLDEPWRSQDITGLAIDQLLPQKLQAIVLPLLQEVARTGKRVSYDEASYEGFLTTRGRTYWRVSIERSQSETSASTGETALFITVEDVTETVRSRLHLHAIHSISSAIAGPSSLYMVLERILQALQELVGSSRCAIYLLDWSLSASEARFMGQYPPADQREGGGYALAQPLQQPISEHSGQTKRSDDFPQGYEPLPLDRRDIPQTATMVAQRGVHPVSQDWHPAATERTLIGHIVRDYRTMIITDTRAVPEMVFPQLDDQGMPRRPGSVLCVPIFEPHAGIDAADPEEQERSAYRVLGTIEVYHRRERGFPAEEVELLERFAQQAGLAIQNARLFRSIDRWARAAGRQARQKENIMQAMPDGVVIYDPRWRVADVNSAARQLLGWSDVVIGMPFRQAFQMSRAIFPEDFLAEPDPVAEMERRASSGQVDEVKVISASGRSLTLRCTYTPIRDDLGDIFAFILIFHDVTDEVAARERIEAEVIVRTMELKQRNEALQQAKAAQELTHARMALLLDRLPSGVILVNAKNMSITIINRQAVQIFQELGVRLEPRDDPDEACRRAVGLECDPILRELPTYSPTGVPLPYEERPFYRAVVHGENCEAELQLVREDGQPIFLLVNAAPLRALDGRVTSAILLFQEITRIKTLERAREDFFTTMAHELKTPLANIRAHLSALLAHDLQWSSEEQYAYLRTADEQVERIVSMIHHFLDASRVEAGALHLELEPVILPELFEDLQDRLAALITSSQRTLHICVPETLPAVVGDYELLISVLTNLLSNAFRYAPEGDRVVLGAELVGSDSSSAQPGAVRISVADRGPGITPEQQEALFLRFSTFAASRRPSVDRPGQPAIERVRKSARWSPATGLGLYISRGIVEAHGSELMLTSSPGQGATFSFVLPTFQGKQENSGGEREMFSSSARPQHTSLEGM